MIQKVLLCSLFFISSIQLLAQGTTNIIHANSDRSYFVEGKNGDKTAWYLDPALDLDVYETNRLSKATWIYFHTDIDSFKIKMKPGERYDFVVILNGKDSCFNQIRSAATITRYSDLEPATHDTIPFVLTEANNIVFRASINETDSIDLFFDTGATGIVMTHEAIAQKTQLLTQEEADYQARDFVPLSKPISLEIGLFQWKDLTVYPSSVGPDGTDGHFGWDLFDGRVVEIDYEKRIMIVHSSLNKIPKAYSKLDILYLHTLFCIEGKVNVRGKSYKNRYLFDTGYQRTVILDSVIRQDDQFPRDLPAIKTTELRNSSGTVFVTKIVKSDYLQFGRYKALDVPSQLLSVPNPARFKTHILGGELLKRFDTILDFQDHHVYLKPNRLMSQPYIDG